MAIIEWVGGLPGKYNVATGSNWVGDAAPGVASVGAIDATQAGPYMLFGTLTPGELEVIGNDAILGATDTIGLIIVSDQLADELAVTGGGSLTIAPIGTFIGNDIVQVGTSATSRGLLTVQGTLGAAAIDLLVGGTLDVTAAASLTGDINFLGGILTAVTAPGATGTSTATLTDAVHLLMGGANLMDSGLATLALEGVIDGSGTLLISAGTVALGGDNSYTGETSIITSEVLAANATAIGSGPLNFLDGALLVATSGTIASTIYVNYDATIGAAHGQTLTLEPGNAGLNGLLTIGAAGYDGIVAINDVYVSSLPGYALEIAAGTARVLAGAGLINGYSATIAAGATYDLGSSSDLANTIGGTGVLIGAGGRLSLNTGTFAGTVAGSLELTIDGDQTLTGSDLSTAAVSIASSDTLQLGVGGSGPNLLGSIDDAGFLLVDRSDAATIDGVIFDTGTLLQEGSGTVTLAKTNSFVGGVTLHQGGVELGAIGAAGGGTIAFAATANATLRIDLGDAPSNTIAGFANGDLIDLPGMGLASHATLAGQNTLVVTGGSDGPVDLQLDPSQSFVGSYFHLAGDTHGGTQVTVDSMPCYCRGTLIRTAEGDVAVEELRVGDRLVTHAGALSEITWIGQRRVDIGRHAHPEWVRPVRIRAGAFADGLPARDLLVSPDHAIFVRDVLVPARHLVNGATVVDETDCIITHYFHVELIRHDILLAEGLPAESYLDTGNRHQFAGAVTTLHPHFSLPRDWSAACARLVTEGPELLSVRQQLRGRLHRLGYRLAEEGVTVAVGGHVLAPLRRDRRVLSFLLPAAARECCVLSSAGVPAALDPHVGDTRRLGACIAGLVLDGRVIPLDSHRLGAGFHPREGDVRWTSGNAHIALPANSHPCVLEINVRDVLPGWQLGGRPATVRVKEGATLPLKAGTA